MSKNRILYVCQEVFPYIPDSTMSMLCRKLASAMHDLGNDVRTFMPRYGVINERRNQLHEVIRLSGMNLIIDDNDHQLIIKVGSIPGARVQIYFIDNDDYFHRKATVADIDGNYFTDNDERAIFFARGVLETVKKLTWEPDIVHCHGWFSSIIPVYLRGTFADDPIFSDSKIVVSLYKDVFPGLLDEDVKQKIENEGISDKKLSLLDVPSYENLAKLVIDYADGVIVEENIENDELSNYLKQSEKPVLEWDGDKSDQQYMDLYQQFYDELLK